MKNTLFVLTIAALGVSQSSFGQNGPGACCTIFGCVAVSAPNAQSTCENSFEGVYLGDGTACTTGACDVLLGACCQDSGAFVVCYSAYPYSCNTTGLVFGGSGTQCASATPPDCTDFLLPVELARFHAMAEAGRVVLSWQTISESNNSGFEVQHLSGSEFQVPGSRWETLGFVEGRGTTAESRSYSYTVAGLDPGKHAFRLNQIDFAGTSSLSTVVEVTVAVPDRYVMKAAYPNPFNPSTTIRYAVATDQQVAASLHDVLGREVRSLGVLSVGANEIHDLRVDATGLQTGIYIVRLSGETFNASQRVLYLK